MKRISIFFIALSSFAFASAQQASPCADLTSNLSRGAESASVLNVQKFLYSKGFLRATPNGYFGPGTYAAVRAYQQSKRITATGTLGPLTRAAIKQESCKVQPEQAFAQAFAQAAQAYASSTPQVSTTTTTVTPVVSAETLAALRPRIDSFDYVTLFENGQTDWTFNMYGSNFQTTGNGIFMRNISTGKTYNLGLFASPDGKTLTFPKNLTDTSFPCGLTCNERLTSGKYEVTVIIFGPPISDPRIIEIKPFTISASTGALQGALVAQGANQRFGTVSFSTAESVLVTGASLVTSSSTISASGVSGTVIKNEMTGVTFDNSLLIGNYQSAILGAYVTTNNTKAGDLWGTFSVEVYDYIGKKKTKFMSSPFLVTVAGLI